MLSSLGERAEKLRTRSALGVKDECHSLMSDNFVFLACQQSSPSLFHSDPTLGGENSKNIASDGHDLPPFLVHLRSLN